MYLLLEEFVLPPKLLSKMENISLRIFCYERRDGLCAIYGREGLARNSRGARSHPQVDTRGYARVRFHGQATGDRAHALVTPICLLLASAERKRSGCLPLAFRHTPTRALALPLAKHVPNLEQRRRHANPWDISAQTRRLFPRRSVD